MKAIAFLLSGAASLSLPSCNAFPLPAITPHRHRHRHRRLVTLPPAMVAMDDGGTTATVPEVYPLSRKKAMLIEEANRLNATRGSYSSVGWSNRLGTVLTPASIPGVYTADRPFYWNGIDVGGRMTIVKLGNGDLVVHSPVGLDPPLIDAIHGLVGGGSAGGAGCVLHVISPNYEHVKYASAWAEHYPDARMWGCPGIVEREPDVRWTGEVPRGARPPGFPSSSAEDDGVVVVGGGENNDIEMMWDTEELQPLHVDTEANPFTGRPFFEEVVFYHAPSRTLLTTDLYWNYPRGDGVTNGQVLDELAAKGIGIGARNSDSGDGDYGVWELAPDVGRIPLGSRLWGKVGMDKLFRPFYMNFMVRDDRRDEFGDIARFITCGGGGDGAAGGWEVETIIPAHGDIVRGKELCRKVLETHFNIRCTGSTNE